MFMLIIGKILEGSLMSLIMKKSNVTNGKRRISFRHMLMVASMNIGVNFRMVGKSRNIIL